MANAEYKVVGAVEDTDYVARLEAEAKKKEKGVYARTVFIGVGGTGSKSLLHLRRLVLERFGSVSALEGVAYLSIDTDTRSQEVSAEEKKQSFLDRALAFERDERVNVRIDFKSYVGPNIIHHPQIREWWDEAALPSDDFQIEAGAGQIRPLARLAFFTNKTIIQDAVRRAYTKVSSNLIAGDRVDMSSPVRIVIVTGLAGGTGSGMVLDIAALVRLELQHHESPKVEGFFVLPGGFSTVENAQNYPKIAANGYAALRELNHYLTHPFEARWDSTAAPVEVRGLYDRHVLFSGTNSLGEHLGDLSDCYRAIGETLFLDFGAGSMAGWIQGVRVNREQYLRSAVTYTYRLPKVDGSDKETHTEEWRNAFSSAGISKLVFPSWRLINKAKYDLAREMVALLDPGRFGELSDVVTNFRDRFMFDCGFFQGTRETDEGRRQHWQIRDRLASQTGAGTEIASVYEHIAKYQLELGDLAESMYTEGNTLDECEAVWKRISGFWGDPTTPGNEGDWAIQIRTNRGELIREVHTRLPQAIEDFRRKPSIGISGMAALLKNMLATLDRPADQERYTDWFKQQRIRLAKEIEEKQRLWKERLKNAERAARGFGKSPENHHKAVVMAGEALNEYWRARVNDLICEEGERALIEIRKSVKDQLSWIEQIAERMYALESQFRQLAEFYSKPQPSVIVREIDVKVDAEGDLLEPYLGRQADERSKRLERLLDRGLRQMGLDTLEDLGSKLAGEFEKFRDRLAAQAFYALRGENGKTAAFTENPDEAVDGFIERYSIFKMLKGGFNREKRLSLFDQLYKKGMPWAQRNKTEALLNLHEPHGDSFVGFIFGAAPDIEREMVEHLQKAGEARFAPKAVSAYDPSEIIFYTELNAYPVYYMSEISGLKSFYESFINDTSRSTPLHVHQDYHKFQELVPLSTGLVANFQMAWNLFLQAQLLGLIRSLRQRVNDDSRIVYQWRRKVGIYQVQWADIGSEGRVIQRLMTDNGTARQLRSDVEDELKRFLKTKLGSWSYLVALADYYYFCVFPVRSTPMAVADAPLGSMQNLVTLSLREEWRAKEEGSNDLEARVKGILETLSEWAIPIYRDNGQIVPRTPALKPSDRLEEWQLTPQVDRALDAFIDRRALSESRDSQGNLCMTYPRLAIHWPFFENSDSEEDEGGGESDLWHYAGDRGRESGLTTTEVAERVRQNPGGSHRVWAGGMTNWQNATNIPGVAALLSEGVRKAEGPPPLDGPPQRQPPSLDGAPTLTTYHYARDKVKLGELSAKEIAEAMRAHPTSEHKVWTQAFGQKWKLADTVAEISSELLGSPPPLD